MVVKSSCLFSGWLLFVFVKLKIADY
jgi:hypothetical protein